MGATTTSIGAAMPTASSPAAAIVPRFIRCPPPSLAGRLYQAPQQHDVWTSCLKLP
jgi:hypothetical protein